MKTTKMLVFDVLADHLAPSEVQALVINDEVDADGDPVLRIQVVIKHDGPAPAPEKLFSATGVVLRVLESMQDHRFPLLTFPSSNELPGVAA